MLKVRFLVFVKGSHVFCIRHEPELLWVSSSAEKRIGRIWRNRPIFHSVNNQNTARSNFTNLADGAQIEEPAAETRLRSPDNELPDKEPGNMIGHPKGPRNGFPQIGVSGIGHHRSNLFEANRSEDRNGSSHGNAVAEDGKLLQRGITL